MAGTGARCSHLGPELRSDGCDYPVADGWPRAGPVLHGFGCNLGSGKLQHDLQLRRLRKCLAAPRGEQPRRCEVSAEVLPVAAEGAPHGSLLLGEASKRPRHVPDRQTFES